MKLYEAKRNSVVEIIDDDVFVPPDSPQLKKGDIIKFHHVDGMYSYCHAKDYEDPVHVAAYTEVKYV